MKCDTNSGEKVRFKKDLGNPQRFDLSDEFATDRDTHDDGFEPDANRAMNRYLGEMEALDSYWRIAKLPRLH